MAKNDPRSQIPAPVVTPATSAALAELTAEALALSKADAEEIERALKRQELAHARYAEHWEGFAQMAAELILDEVVKAREKEPTNGEE